MARKKRSPEENERRAKIRELLLTSDVSSMEDIQNLFKEMIAEFMENGLEAELEDELGYSKYDYRNKENGQQPEWVRQQNTADESKGMSTGDIETHIRDIYGIEVSDTT